jgi:hypothetical protein
MCENIKIEVKSSTETYHVFITEGNDNCWRVTVLKSASDKKPRFNGIRFSKSEVILDAANWIINDVDNVDNIKGGDLEKLLELAR